MQEKKKPVFVVATANNIAQLPPELLRKGRVDEIFFVDLPTVKEREDILNIHISKKSRKTLPAKQVEKLAEESKGFTGAELEEAVKDAMYRAFDDDRELSAEDISAAIKATTPLSQTMRDVINDTRKWAKGRAVMASREEPEELEDRSEEAVRLPQECYNPFSKV
jgi:SpoVK/Ycf46/Vps4 family AAA+-type ATPase